MLRRLGILFAEQALAARETAASGRTFTSSQRGAQTFTSARIPSMPVHSIDFYNDKMAIMNSGSARYDVFLVHSCLLLLDAPGSQSKEGESTITVYTVLAECSDGDEQGGVYWSQHFH
jgi:hypothetical protein